MEKLEFAVFLSLDGRAEEAIAFYQTVFGGKLLFKISNKVFCEQFTPNKKVPKEEENYISHSIVQIGNIQLQIADNPVYDTMSFKKRKHYFI